MCPCESVTALLGSCLTAPLIQLTCLLAWNTAFCPVLVVPVANETLLLDANELIVSASQVRSFHIPQSQQLNCSIYTKVDVLLQGSGEDICGRATLTFSN